MSVQVTGDGGCGHRRTENVHPDYLLHPGGKSKLFLSFPIFVIDFDCIVVLLIH